MGIEAERGVGGNWNTPLSVPTTAALPTMAPVGAICRLEDSGLSVQWSGTAWTPFPLGSGGGGGASFATVYVAKGGSDIAGDGSAFNPFLTIQRGITAAAAASAIQPFKVSVGVGVFADPFALQPWQFIVGAGRNLTTLSPIQANWIGARFSAAGAQDTGIMGCALAAPLNIDFVSVGSPGAGQFYLYDSLFATSAAGIALSVLGNNIANVFHVQNTEQIGTGFPVTASIANIQSRIDALEFRGTSLTLSNNANYSATCLMGSYQSTGQLTVSAASAVNLQSLLTDVSNFHPSNPAPLNLVGDGASVVGASISFFRVGVDANVTFGFADNPAGAIRMIDSGDNYIDVPVLTAPRTWTIGLANTGTRLRIANIHAFPITLTFVGTGPRQSYIETSEAFEGEFSQGIWTCYTAQIPQTGRITLVGGVSPFIPADVYFGSSIIMSLSALNGSAAVGIPSALFADRVQAPRNLGGGFIIRSLTAAGAPVATDVATYDWHVTRNA
jgi:hypothetical protein